MTREELIELVKEIYNVKGKSEKEQDELLLKLENNVLHPEVSNLIYWEDLTPEQVVDKALAYKPIQL
ncbi:bacteriocin immunity protein [Mesonia sp. K4-1]|uniref:bacteriocin immunity protein n=1 Tax=Mesonia sp. K4-1 TaxID=2602760 RepID=UPI0011CC449F|nr:bacteriocin immunity protein [Mesonia sp. K4-1]TXK74401.1 bacteriocin immunity protein [Mesonia sp. K4-1]